jgi:hypothetical protein
VRQERTQDFAAGFGAETTPPNFRPNSALAWPHQREGFMRRGIVGLVAAAALAGGIAQAAPAKKAAAEPPPYGRDLISVATPGRQAAPAPSNDCVVWANAEGLGVGPAQLGGLHGVVMHLNEAPLSSETATTFAAGLAELKATYPTAPAWLVGALEKNKAAIQNGCAADHPEPFVVKKLTAADRG